MMQFSLRCIFLLLLFTCQMSYAQVNWDWAISGGGDTEPYSQSSGYAIDFDNDGNTYMVGGISSPSNIGGLTLDTYNANPGWSDILISKYDETGNLLWAKSAGGQFTDYAKDIELSNDGHLYVCGIFNGQAEFDEFTIGTANVMSYFVAKLDAEGNFIWVKHGDAPYVLENIHHNLAIHMSNDEYIYFSGYSDGGDQILGSSFTTPGQFGYTAFFLTQFDAEGNLNWVHFVDDGTGGSGGNMATDIVEDQFGNIIYAANIHRKQNISPTSTSYYSNMIMGKLDSSGNPVWEKEFGDPTINLWSGFPYGITIDGDGSIYVCGIYFKNFILANSGNTAGGGGFMAKFDSMTGTVISANSLKASNGTIPGINAVSYDGIGNVLYSGTIIGTVDFGGISLSPLSTTNNSDIFTASYDTSGSLNWAVRYGYEGYDGSAAIHANDNKVAITGIFPDSLAFGANTIYADNYDVSARYLFLAVGQIGDPTDLIQLPNSELSFSIYPNPASSLLTIETVDALENYTVELYTMDSYLLKRFERLKENQIDISDLPTGSYLLSLRNEKVALIKRFVKVD